MSFAKSAMGANAIKCKTLDTVQNDLLLVQRKLLKDLLTKIAFYDFPQTNHGSNEDKVETVVIMCCNNNMNVTTTT